MHIFETSNVVLAMGTRFNQQNFPKNLKSILNEELHQIAQKKLYSMYYYL